MPVERVEWQCPNCKKRYAIPANLPRPSLCPKCQPTQEPENVAPDAEPPVPPQPAPTEPPAQQPPEVSPPASPPDFAPARYRRKYPALRVISLFYRISAGFIVLATVVAFVASIVGIFRAENQDARWNLVYFGLGSLVGGAFWSVSVLAFAELIQVALDIEQNTRQK
jgi:hypothetical protein